MNIALFIAAILSGGITLIHIVLGGKEIARPLLAAEGLRGIPKYSLYYCWHLVSLTLAGMALAFLLAALSEVYRPLGTFATAGAALFTLLCLGINGRFSRPMLAHPQWLMFLTVTLIGAYGLWR
jgi:hypothetical protein